MKKLSKLSKYRVGPLINRKYGKVKSGRSLNWNANSNADGLEANRMASLLYIWTFHLLFDARPSNLEFYK